MTMKVDVSTMYPDVIKNRYHFDGKIVTTQFNEKLPMRDGAYKLFSEKHSKFCSIGHMALEQSFKFYKK
jgi:hypothetical protein